MGISGNLKTMSLPDIFQWLHIGGKTGTLSVEHDGIAKKIFFDNGSIVSSYSNSPREYFGQFLLNLGKITEEQLQAAMEEQVKSGVLIGRIFVNEGLVTEAEVKQVLTYKAEETIYDLFLWPEGGFKFSDGERQQGAQVTISLTVDKITFEGIRRVDEWRRIRKVFPSGNVVMRLVPEKIPSDLRGDPMAARVLALVARRRTILDVGLETRSSEFQISKTLYDWYSQGFLLIDEIRQEVVAAPPPPKLAVADDATLRAREFQALIESAQSHRANREFDDALKAVTRALELDPRSDRATTLRTDLAEEYHRYLDAYFGGGQKIPVLNVSLQELMTKRTDFTPEEGFIVSRINGIWNVQSIIKVSPIPEFHALRILKRLEQERIISLK